MSTLNDVFMAFVILGLLLLIGNAIHRSSSVWQSLYIPGSILAGITGLLLGPEVLGTMARLVFPADHPLTQGAFPKAVLNVWAGIPAVFISVVFATLFLGKSLPSIREIWRLARPQIMFGQTTAWGQYVIGIALTMLVLTPLFHMNPLAGALIEISFEGGHGTAAGLADTFDELGFPEGADLALGLATFSLVAGTVLGTILVNWGARTGKFGLSGRHGETRRSTSGPKRAGAPSPRSPIDPTWTRALDIADTTGSSKHSDGTDGVGTTASAAGHEAPSIELLSLQLGFVALSIGIGWLILQVLIYVESVTTVRLGAPSLMPYIPLFPLAMIGSIFVQLLVDRLGLKQLLDRSLIERISGTALDVTIVAALATLSLSVIGDNWAPFLLLALAGTAWNLFGFFVLAPRMFPEYWFERGIADFGQGMGVTVTGLLLLRLADPHNRSGTLETFGYKQLLFEPIVGGGIFTAAAMPLIYQFGPLAVLILTGAITTFWLVLGLRGGRASAG